jgi:C1A family cysteine protease
MADNGGNQALPDFGGLPLEQVPGLTAAEITALRGYGFSDAEQVMAALAVPNIIDRLKAAIGVSDAAMDDLVQKLRGVVPMMAAAADTDAFPLGALQPTPEIEAMVMESVQPQIAAVELPPSVNHAAQMPPGRNQGSRGTCVSFAMTAVHEYYDRLNGGGARDYSEQFLYHETKLIDGNPGVCGTWQIKARQVLGNLGQCLEQAWSYNPNPPCNNNGTEPASARTDAANHTLATVVLDPRNVTAIKTALATGCVVGFSIPVYNSWYQSSETARTGRITMRIGSEPANGGHAMCLVGYQDEDASPGGGYFILRNSWFGSWGTQCPYGSGNGTIPYAYLSSENWEAVTTQPPPNYVS